MASQQKGASLEELVRAYFARQGFFALRGVSYRFEDEEVTDIDVWLYGRQTASVRTRTVVDVKDKRSPKAFERVLWTRGLQLALGADRAVVATTETSPKVMAFAQQQKVALLSKSFLERLSKSLDTAGRLSAEQMTSYISEYSSHKQDGDWLKKLSEAKSAVVSLPGFPAFNKAISAFRFFAERVETRPQHRDQATRCAFLCAALACIALDSALERSLYDDAATKYQSIMTGVTYGDAGDSRVQSSISKVINVIAGGMENGRVIARQVADSFNDIFSQVRADIVAEYFVREQNSSVLFAVAKELDEWAFSLSNVTPMDLSKEARSVVGVFADFSGVRRRYLVGHPADTAQHVAKSGLETKSDNNVASEPLRGGTSTTSLRQSADKPNDADKVNEPAPKAPTSNAKVSEKDVGSVEEGKPEASSSDQNASGASRSDPDQILRLL